jgi:lysophospholipase L1-like esterase
MTSAACSFHGSSFVKAAFKSAKKGARMRVLVDGVFTHDVQVVGSTKHMTVVTLAENLSIEHNHTVEFIKVTEDMDQAGKSGVMAFGGFIIDGREGEIGFGPKPPAWRRKLEVIGDSDSAGWCADGSPFHGGDNFLKYQDGYKTWAQQVARNVSAETFVEAVSGYGISSNSTPIETVLDNTLGFDHLPKWNYSTWIPDAVLMLIGPNDESDVASAAFIKDYLKLMRLVSNHYADAPTPPKLINVCGGSLNGLDPCQDIRVASHVFNSQHDAIKSYFVSITREHWKLINAKNGKSPYNGCDGHYNEKGHRVLAGDIIPQIRKIMGWQD